MRIFRTIAAAALLIFGFTDRGNAEIIIVDSPSFNQPEENLLLEGADLITIGTMVQGQTNQTDTIFNIIGSEELTLLSKGQARVAATEGNYSWARVDALDPLLYFTLFEANVNVAGATSITIRATDSDGGSTEFAYNGKSGQNFFGVKATDGQMIDFILISASNELIEDIRQIRVGGIGKIDDDPGDFVPAPEPTSLLLFGSGLSLIGLAAWRKRK